MCLCSFSYVASTRAIYLGHRPMNRRPLESNGTTSKRKIGNYRLLFAKERKRRECLGANGGNDQKKNVRQQCDRVTNSSPTYLIEQINTNIRKNIEKLANDGLFLKEGIRQYDPKIHQNKSGSK